MKIAEIFYSIQGEGELMGVPSVFVRTSGCDLRCWFCDTPYTSWKPEGDEMPVDEIVFDVLEHGAKHVVITGGEPMLNQFEMITLTRELAHENQHITIETTGRHSIDPKDLFCDLMSMSPKFASSTPSFEKSPSWSQLHEKRRWDEKSRKNFRFNRTWFPHQVKFVMSSRDDMAEILPIVEEFSIEPERVFLMPEGITSKAIRDKADWVVSLCKEHGFRYCPRLHIDLWGNVRGV